MARLLSTSIDMLAGLYAERRLMVIAMVAARQPSGLQLFSNAFKLRGPTGPKGEGR